MLYESPSAHEWSLMIAFLTYGHMNWVMPPKDVGDLIKKCMKPATVKQLENILIQ